MTAKYAQYKTDCIQKKRKCLKKRLMVDAFI